MDRDGFGATPDIDDACAREQIQFLGAIQPHGMLIECSNDWIVIRASANLADYLGTDAVAALGAPLADLVGPTIVHDLRGRLQLLGERDAAQHVFGAVIPSTGRSLDLAIHRTATGIVVEGEGSVDDDADVASTSQALLAQLRHLTSVAPLAALLVRQVRALTQFDRVMVYRFHDDDSGEVIAEAKAGALESFKGLRYPASDIPAQARALYLRNPIRLIADVASTDSPVLPPTDQAGRRIDLSMAGLRAVSPVHIEYLRNMGVAASMSISLVVGGKLWGLISCHHQQPRVLSMRRRAALDFYGQMVSSTLESIARAEQLDGQAQTRALHDKMLAQLHGETGTIDDLVPQFERIQDMLGADGFAVYVDGLLQQSGITPSAAQTTDLTRFFNRGQASRIYTTHALSAAYPPAADYAETVSGALVIPVSRSPRDYVIFFRQELPSSVVWAGEPKKHLDQTDGHVRISPRRSFAAWRETVRHQSAPWTNAERAIAEGVRVTLLELMLQLTDSAEKKRKASNDQQDLLIAELNHRVRNILNLIVGLVRQCSDSALSIEDFSTEVSARVHALARAHDQLTSSGWGARSIRHMIRVEAGAYLADKADRVTITGDEMGIQPDAFATVALVMHELITNSAKYGAFRDSHGGVDIHLTCDPDTGMVIDWRERGGAPVKTPTRRGFGSTIIERAIPHELGGSAMVEFDPAGLHARFELPARYLAECVHDADEIAAIDLMKPRGDEERLSGPVLLVEDNLLIALETENILYALGADSVHVASSVNAALAHLGAEQPTFAVLDYNLGREQSVPIAERLAAMDVPFVFATGYGDTSMIDARFRNRTILTKPFTAISVLNGYNATKTRIEATAD